MPFFGYHAVYEKDYRTALQAAADHGFQFVQFDLNVPAFYIDGLSRRQLKDLRSLAADLGVMISFHAPGDSVGLFTDYPAIRRGLLDHMRLVLRQANRLNARHLTVHPLSPPSFRRADSGEDSFQAEHQGYFKQVLKENLARLAESAGNVLLVVENCHLGTASIAALSELFHAGTRVFLALDWAKMHNAAAKPDDEQGSFFAKH